MKSMRSGWDAGALKGGMILMVREWRRSWFFLPLTGHNHNHKQGTCGKCCTAPVHHWCSFFFSLGSRVSPLVAGEKGLDLGCHIPSWLGSPPVSSALWKNTFLETLMGLLGKGRRIHNIVSGGFAISAPMGSETNAP